MVSVCTKWCSLLSWAVFTVNRSNFSICLFDAIHFPLKSPTFSLFNEQHLCNLYNLLEKQTQTSRAKKKDNWDPTNAIMTSTSSASGAIISSPKSMHVPEKHSSLVYNLTAMDGKCVHNSVYSIGITNLLPFHVDQVDAICMSMNFDQYQRKLSWNDKNDNESSHLYWANIRKSDLKTNWLAWKLSYTPSTQMCMCVCLWKSRCVYLICACFSSFDPCHGAYVHFFLTSNGIDSVCVSQWIVCWTEIVKDIDFILPVRGVWINH